MENLLNGYRCAVTGVVGMGLMAFATPARAEIVYTATDVRITPNTRYDLDLNNDGLGDFQLVDRRSSLGAALSIRTRHDEVVSQNQAAAALILGATIGSNTQSQRFIGNPNGIAMIALNPSGSVGFWGGKGAHYLGLKFEINGQDHYGWARITTLVNRETSTIKARLTGYAYETNASKGIRAGQTMSSREEQAQMSGPRESKKRRISSLADLALGKAALSALRFREDCDAEEPEYFGNG